MKSTHFFNACVLVAGIVASFVVCWEYYWRSRGFTASYNDDKVLWAIARKQVYRPADLATIFIGGSRIKFDLDVATWEKLTGEEVIQLAIVATSPRLTLRDLANDSKFKGKLIIDVTENQFFSIDTIRRDKSAREAIEYYQKETPAQKASATINYALESKIVFLEEGKFGLNALLNGLNTRNRPGVVAPPAMPKEFTSTRFNRQTSMTAMFLANKGIQEKQIAIWTKTGISTMGKTPGITGDTLESTMKTVKACIDRIRARGGVVMFVRPPSSNRYLEAEKKHFPRQQYWDRLLAYTNTAGIHFSDYPETANLVCPEWSHLGPADAVTYTTHLVKILREEKGWTFPHADHFPAHHLRP